MLSTKLFRFVRTPYILAAVLTVFGLQLHGQGPDPHISPGMAWKTAVARRLAGRVTGSLMPAATLALPKTPGTFITFDVPAAVCIGTFPISINPAEEIAGFYGDANCVPRPFLRTPGGAVITFDVPNDIGLFAFNGTPSINPAGTITAPYFDANGLAHGFVRASDGSITTFDAPGATGGTSPSSINPGGAITGFYSDVNGSHGFLWASNGTFSTFDAPGCVGSTYPFAINSGGVVAGICFANGQGFFRDHDGTVTAFDAPGFINGAFNGLPFLSINPAGEITGTYFDANNAWHGFLRTSDGNLTVLDAPGAGSGPYQGTYPEGINPAGEITGFYSDANGLPHGFLRSPDGTFTTFDAPGVGGSNCGYPGTVPSGINQSGDITGFYSDANCELHGFLLTKH